MILTLSARVGYVLKATSVKNRRRSMPSISNTHTWESIFPVRSPTSLFNTLFKNVFVSSSPFKRISASPLCTSSTAFNAAASVSGSLMISKSVRSMSIEAAISRILASSPTRMAVAMFCSFAALTACSTGSSCALETETFFKVF